MNDAIEGQEDQLLGAYLDNELAAADADALTNRIASEPLLEERLRQLRLADDRAREQFRAIDKVPLPPGVLDLLQRDAASSADGIRANNVVGLAPRAIRPFLQVPVALAAGLALLAGFFIANQMQQSSDDGASGLFARDVPTDSTLHELLETGSGADNALLAAETTGTLRLTFEDVAGDYCRQIDIAGSAANAQALACRRNGQWRMEAVSFAAPASAAYQSASSNTSKLLEASIDAMIGPNEPLEESAEKLLISNSWK